MDCTCSPQGNKAYETLPLHLCALKLGFFSAYEAQRHWPQTHTHTRTVSLCPGKCVLIFELNLFHTGGESLMSPQAELLRGRLVAELWLCGGMFCLVALWTTTDRGESTVHTSAALRGDAQAAFWGEKISHGGREGGIEGGKEIAV